MTETTIHVDESFLKDGELADRVILTLDDGEHRGVYERVDE